MTIREIERAAAGLRDVIHSIPVSSSKTFSDMSGAELYMKCENLQKTGSFKVRGAYNKIARLAGEGVREVVASSAGNHAQVRLCINVARRSIDDCDAAQRPSGKGCRYGRLWCACAALWRLL